MECYILFCFKDLHKSVTKFLLHIKTKLQPACFTCTLQKIMGMAAIISPHSIWDDFLLAWLSTLLLDCCQLEITVLFPLDLRRANSVAQKLAHKNVHISENFKWMSSHHHQQQPLVCQRPEWAGQCSGSVVRMRQMYELWALKGLECPLGAHRHWAVLTFCGNMLKLLLA